MSFAETFQKLLRIPDQGAAKNDVSSFRRWVPAVTPAPKPPEPDIGAAAASFVDRLSKFAEVVCPECGKKPGKYKIQGDAITCGQCSATSDMEKWEKSAEKSQKVYAVDLDGTLAHHAGEFDPEVVGEPIEAMMKRVKKWIADGHTVKIFTARAATESNIPPVRKWLKKHGLGDLEITNEKTPDMNFFVDDKAVAISRNKGTTTHRKLSFLIDRYKVAGDDDLGLSSIAKTAGISSYLKVLRDKFVEARKRVHLTPTKPQMEAGNYRKGHVWMQGLDITIENPKGSTRSGETKDGRKWTCTMAADYGDIRNFPRSRADGDNMDIFVGPHPTSEVVFVIDQYIDGEFDEHKCMCGFFTAKEAKDAYVNSFDDKWKGFGAITTLTMNQFKNWLRSKNTAEAIAGQDLSEYIKKAMLECESMEKQASARRNSRSEFREARNEAVAAGKVPMDMPFYVNGSSCIVNAGDWHEKEQIKASVDLASEYFDHVKEENECGLPPGYVPVKLSDEAHRKARKLDREGKQAADNSWMPPMAASFFDSPMVSNSTVAIGSGALRGALVAALIHGMRTLKRESQGENKRDLNLTRDLMLGAGIGAGSGALLHWVPDMAGAIHSATTPKAAHIMDVPLAPLSMGGMAAPIIGTGYGAIAGLAGGIGTKIKKKITGEPEYEGELIDSMLDGAQKGLGISSIAAASGTSTVNSPAAAAPVRPQRKGRLVSGNFPAYVRK